MEKVLPANEYLIDLLKEIEESKKYVFLQSMLFEFSPNIQKIEVALLKAVKRGVDVRINYDWVSGRYFHGELPKFPVLEKEKRGAMSAVQKENKKMHKRLKVGGVKLTVTNYPSLLISAFPYIGRSHIKMSIIDDNFCYVGGVNLYNDAFDNLDLMVKSEKQKLIEILKNLFFEINDNKNKDDFKINIDSEQSLYVDVGNKNKSIIYETAIKRIKSAKKSLYFMSQFVPDTNLLKEVEYISDNGVDVKIFTSPEDDSVFTKYPEKLTYVMLKKSIEDRKNIELIHLSKKVHAKLLIIDHEIALYGSHNYIYSGVLFGTAEIMIENKNKKIINELEEYIISCKNLN